MLLVDWDQRDVGDPSAARGGWEGAVTCACARVMSGLVFNTFMRWLQKANAPLFRSGPPHVIWTVGRLGWCSAWPVNEALPPLFVGFMYASKQFPSVI